MKKSFFTLLVLSAISFKAVAGMSLFSGPNSGTTKPMPQPTNVVFNPPMPFLSAQGVDTNAIAVTMSPGFLTTTNSAQRGYVVNWNSVNNFATSQLLTIITNSSTSPFVFTQTGIPGSPNGTTNFYWIATWN